jgi:hypothetical protein
VDEDDARRRTANCPLAWLAREGTQRGSRAVNALGVSEGTRLRGQTVRPGAKLSGYAGRAGSVLAREGDGLHRNKSRLHCPAHFALGLPS